MEAQVFLICFLVVIGIIFVQIVLRRLMNKGVNAVERAIRPEAAQQSDSLLGTTVIFETTATIAVVRQSVASNVPVVDKIGHKMKVLDDSASGISWAIGLPSMGSGAVVVLRYKEKDGGTIAMFEVTQHVTKGGVSPFVNQLTELRNQVITAFRAADPNVKVTSDTHDVTYKMSWF